VKNLIKSEKMETMGSDLSSEKLGGDGERQGDNTGHLRIRGDTVCLMGVT